MSAIDILMGVVKSVAPVAANLVVPGSGSLLNGLIESVMPKDVTTFSEEAAAEHILEHPELIEKLKAKAMELEATIAQEQTKNMSDVNETMRAELNAESWYQRAWRPFNGFMFPIALILNYIVLPVYLAPKFVTVPTIPEWALVAWAGILGVAVHGRNKQKQQAVGVGQGGLLSKAIGLIKR